MFLQVSFDTPIEWNKLNMNCHPDISALAPNNLQHSTCFIDNIRRLSNILFKQLHGRELSRIRNGNKTRNVKIK